MLTVIVALEVPLAITLQRRALAELETEAIVEAQTIAATIGREFMEDTKTARTFLREDLMPRFAQQVEGRIIVVDPDGILVADSLGERYLGADYATPQRPEIVAALERQQAISEVRYSDALGQEIMATAVPILDELVMAGAVRITRTTEQVSANVRRIVLGLAVIGLAPLAAGLIFAFALSNSLAQPLTRLADAARRIGGGDLSVRADTTTGAAEIRDLAGSFDEMAARLERIVRAQREFVANASHQLRTPLTGMKLRLESAIEEASTDELRRQLQAAEREVDRLAEIVERLLLMARQIEAGEAVSVDLREAAGRALSRWNERGEKLGATLDLRGRAAVAQADPTDVDQILDNLIDNAIAYAPGPISIETGIVEGLAFLAVEDRGPGIPKHDRARVTERFFRGRGAPSGGSGLGLAIARELAEKWNGRMEVKDGSDGGTRVEIRLLATQPPDGA